MTHLLNLLPENGQKGWPWQQETNPDIYAGRSHWPKITIITPSYNQGHFIEETIRSILLQNYPNLEYIIIDGGSTDNTVDIIKQYEPWIDYWASEADRGQSHAINKGLERATGDIINWLNSDDYYSQGALYTVANAYLEKPNPCITARSRIFGGEKDVFPDRTSVGNSLFDALSKLRIDQPATFFTKEAVEKIGFIDESQYLVMDADWWIKFLFTFGVSKVTDLKQVVVNFREHEDSKTVNNRNKMVVERAKLLSDVLSSLHNGSTAFYANLLSKEEKKLAKLGASDFMIYWLKHFKREKQEASYSLVSAIINPKHLPLKYYLQYLF